MALLFPAAAFESAPLAGARRVDPAIHPAAKAAFESVSLTELTRRENFCNQLEHFSAFVSGADLTKTPDCMIQDPG
jgi:hypothetical protein